MKFIMREAMALRLFFIITVGCYISSVSSFFPSEGKSWASLGFQHEHGRMDRIYMNQHAIKTSHQSEPTSNYKETPEAYVYSLEISGLKKEDLKVEVKDGFLRIKGEKKESEKQDGEVHWSYGQFWKQIPIGDDADSNNIHTDITDGVLTITVPRRHHKGD